MRLANVVGRNLVDLLDDVPTNVRRVPVLHRACRVDYLRMRGAVRSLGGNEALEVLVEPARQVAVPNRGLEDIVDGRDDHLRTARAVGQIEEVVLTAGGQLPYEAWVSALEAVE